VQDLTSHVFHQALANIGRFEWRGAPFAAWLYRIASNAILDHAQRKAREGALPYRDASSRRAASRDTASRDVASREAAVRDAESRDAGSRDAAFQDAAFQDAAFRQDATFRDAAASGQSSVMSEPPNPSLGEARHSDASHSEAWQADTSPHDAMRDEV